MATPEHSDSITKVNTDVLGDAPAMAMGNLMLAVSQALSNAAHNATSAQQQSYITMQAATAQGVATLYSLDTAAAGEATQKIFAESSAAVEAAAMPPAPVMASPDVQSLMGHETADAAYHVRSLMSAFAASLDALSIVSSRQNSGSCRTPPSPSA